MELRHIRYFLAVAEEGNFTRAAVRLGIGQPPLSQQIKALEAEVGTQLFHRVPYGAELTEAGQEFLEAVSTMPAQAEDALRRARRASRGETGKLTLGFTGTASLNPIFPEGIREFRRLYPDVDLQLVEANSSALEAALEEGRVDVAVLRPAAVDPESFKAYELMNEDLIAAVPVADAGEGDGPLDLKALSHLPLILTPRSVGTSLHDVTMAACVAAGFKPVPGPAAPQIVSMLALVAAGLGFALVPASMRQLLVQGMVFRELCPPAPTVSLSVVMQKSLPTPVAANFVQLLRRIASGVQSI